MKKIFVLLTSLFLLQNGVFAMLPPEYMLDDINKSKIKTPAVVKKVKTIERKRGNRVQKVTFTGLYQNEGAVYEGTCINFNGKMPWTIPIVGSRFYYPKKGERVFVTIMYDGGEITSLVIMDEKFEKAVKENPSAIKYDSSGAYLKE